MTDKQTVKFGDICREVKLTTKDPIADGYERYIGLEHLDSGSLKIKRWGLIAEDKPSFTRVFKKGQILFGKRRPYLKKAAVAEFDGICSGDIIVMESRERLDAKELLPYIVQGEKFWNWAIQTSSGSLSPRTKFKSLETLKIDIPSGENQYKAEKIITKVAEVSNLFDELSEATNITKTTLLKSIFGTLGKDWSTKPIGDLFEVQLGKMLSKKAKQGLNPKPYLANFNVQWNKVIISEINYMDFNDREMEKFRLKTGDILVCEGGEIGRSAIWSGQVEECYYQKALHRLRPLQKKLILPEFMVLYMEYKFKISKEFESQSMATTIAHIPREKLITLPVSYPDISTQLKIVNSVNCFVSVRDTFNKNIDKLSRIQQALL